MPTRLQIAALLSLMINSVLFGIGTVAVLSVPALSADAAFYLPAVIIASYILTPPIAWLMAPRMRARYWREQQVPATVRRR